MKSEMSIPRTWQPYLPHVPANHEQNLQRGAAERMSKEELIRPGDSSCLAGCDKVSFDN